MVIMTLVIKTDISSRSSNSKNNNNSNTKTTMACKTEKTTLIWVKMFDQ